MLEKFELILGREFPMHSVLAICWVISHVIPVPIAIRLGGLAT